MAGVLKTSSFFSLKGTVMNKKKFQITSEQLSRYKNKLYPIIETVVNASDLQLIEISFVKENAMIYLRITIMHPDRQITLDDCEAVSKQISKELDSKEVIPLSYTLEVQSAGIENETISGDSHAFTLKDLGLVIKS